MYTANAETSTNAKAFGEVGMAKRADVIIIVKENNHEEDL